MPRNGARYERKGEHERLGHGGSTARRGFAATRICPVHSGDTTSPMVIEEEGTTFTESLSPLPRVIVSMKLNESVTVIC
jgi:hypothetical protein